MLARFASDNFLKSLDRLEFGVLELATPDGRRHIFEGKNPGARAQLQMHDWRVVSNMAVKGDVGFAEDYRSGFWETDNLQNLITLGIQNDGIASRYIFGSRFFQVMACLSCMLRRNTVKGSKANIHQHYDLGNDFYALWLDPSMTYSSALFKNPGENLEQAQNNKYDRILERLGGTSGSLLEIGCGWGGFAERAGASGDFAVKGITLSKEQFQYARRRLGQRADIALEDYRHQQGRFDHIVSIEMFEAVGEQYWPTYFSKLGGLLKQGGTAVIQTITIEDSRFELYRRTSDFIRSYIFPGGMLPGPARFAQEAGKAGLRINDQYCFGQDYAQTLELWLAQFDEKRESIKSMGFDDGFIRLWRFYLAACIAGFRTGRTNVMQAELQHA